MSVPIDAPDSATVLFEREKWDAERAFRERELLLKEQEQKVNDAELDLKRAEYASARWKNPLIVAILAAAIAGAGNAVVSYLNAVSQTRLEAQKSEQARILEMIKTGSPDKAAENLRFLLDAGLISDPDIRAALTTFLDRRKPGSGPALPSAFVPKDLPDLVSRFEGTVLKPYKDAVGRLVIGTGHVLSDAEQRNGTVHIASMEVPYSNGITEEQARLLLDDDLRPVRLIVDKLVTSALTPNQRDALASLVFQVGVNNFRASTLLRKLNAGKYEEVPDEMKRWVSTAGSQMPALVLRREAEVALWKKP